MVCHLYTETNMHTHTNINIYVHTHKRKLNLNSNMLSHLLALFPLSEPSSFNCHHSVFIVYIFAKKIDIMISPKRGIPKKKAATSLFDVVCSVWERERD